MLDLPLTTVGDDFITMEISSGKIQKNMAGVSDGIYHPEKVPVDVKTGEVEFTSIVSKRLNILRTVCPNFPYLYASSKSVAVYERVATGPRLDYHLLTSSQQVSVLCQVLSALNLSHHLLMYSQELTVDQLHIYRRPYTTIQIPGPNGSWRTLETDVIAYIVPDATSSLLYRRRYFTDVNNPKKFPEIKQDVYTLLKSSGVVSPERVMPAAAISNLQNKFSILQEDEYSGGTCFVDEVSPHHIAFNQKTFTRLIDLYVNMPNNLTRQVLTSLFQHLPVRFSRAVKEFSILVDKKQDLDIVNSYNKIKSHLNPITVKGLLRFIKDYSQMFFLYNRELNKESPQPETYQSYFNLVADMRPQIVKGDDQDLINIYCARFEV